MRCFGQPHVTPRPFLLVCCITALLAVSLGCAHDDPVAGGLDAGTDAGPGASADAGGDAALLRGPCEALFGRPNARTGLDDVQCQPTCGCDAVPFVARDWDDASLAALRAYILAPAADALTSDPYAGAPPVPRPEGEVCAVVVDDLATHTYHVATFATADAARTAGAYVTHADACGACSTLADLAVYAGTPDLTAPVRDCGLRAPAFDANVTCLEALGFTHACAQIWAYNTAHTRDVCGGVCLRLLSAPYHRPDGTLNDCLACDEEQSGPVFKAVAGRTRRNSGVASALCRPCSEVPRIEHAYP